MKSIRYIAITLLSLFCFSGAFAAETAEQALSKCLSKLNAGAVDINFILTNQGEKHNCSVTISRKCYRLSAPGVEVWFDGTTQWSYLTKNRELNITEPTSAEIMESNPFAIISDYKSSFKAKRLADAGMVIELSAKSGASNIRKAVLTLNPKTYLPTKVIVTLSSGQTMSAVVTSATTKAAPPASTFKYNKAKYPASEIVDLR